jgi:hypothetical protein
MSAPLSDDFTGDSVSVFGTAFVWRFDVVRLDDMNPKAAEAWNYALAKLESARELIENDQGEQAKTQMAKAVYVGAGTLLYLFGPGPEEQVAHKAAQEFITYMASEECLAAEAFAAAHHILHHIAELSPAEDKLPAP